MLNEIKINLQNINQFVAKNDLENLKPAALDALRKLHDKTGKGNDFLGWVNLSSSISEVELMDIENTVSELSSLSEIVIVIGIGGSYLGAKAVIDALSNSFDPLLHNRKNPLVVFAGHQLSEDYLFELLEMLNGRPVSCIIISKSGTTTEPAIAFRIVKNYLENVYGKTESKRRIVAITDQSKGALKQMATKEGYKTFVIPDDVGGRFSVLTPVGLLPIAVAGFDIRQLVKGAVDMGEALMSDVPYEENICLQYAVARNALYRKGKKVEVMVNYNPKLHFLTEWWKQLYGESEGKEGKGIFPAGVDFTTDLHSMGQYIQDGERMLFETVISVKNTLHKLAVPHDDENLDQLNFMAGKRINEVNKMAEQGTMLAHIDGGVPNIRIEIPEISEYYLGALIYFFEKACGVSGYILDVNPFDQPGVEAYKKNMFALLAKPGYEKQSADLKKRL
ncbi:MAG: glucose-6-phosphate isomerase [Prevotellaceae bacterium]|jgi:glucose-6-phosphate isomerase|nr:glucose-6-phosphate isomerase [Prevotellaceae bacterium]